MYCGKCGNQIDNDSAFCMYCGAKVETFINAEMPHTAEAVNVAEPINMEKTVDTTEPLKAGKGVKKFWPLMIVAVIVAVAVGIGIYNTPENRLKRCLDLGNKYLLEEDYKQAVVAFENAMAIDPKCEDAYRGLADVYVDMGDYEAAIDILEDGIDQTDSDELSEYLKEIKEDYARIQEEEAKRAAEAAEQEAEETLTETAAVMEMKAGFVMIDGELYYYDASGQLIVGWFNVDNNRYCARSDGRLYRNGEYEIDGRKCAFGADGVFLGEINDDAWKQAYIDYIVRTHRDYGDIWLGDGMGYALIYLDNDNIPELVCGDPEYTVFVNYSNNTVQENYLGRYRFTYMERRNLLYNPTGSQGNYEDIIYSIINGKLTVIASGRYGVENNTIAFDESDYLYEWEGQRMTESEYYAELKKVYDDDLATREYGEGYKYGGYEYNYEQIIDAIRNW